ETRSRHMFAQEAIANDVEGVVRQELAETRTSIVSRKDVAWFTCHALQALGGSALEANGVTQIGTAGLPLALRETLNLPESFRARFELPVPEGVEYLGRTHPFVERLA